MAARNLASSVGADPALMDMAIANSDEAHIYLTLLEEPPDGSPGIPWDRMADKQKYTQQICLRILLAEAEARLAQIAAVCVGAAPIGLTITFDNSEATQAAGPSLPAQPGISDEQATRVNEEMAQFDIPSALLDLQDIDSALLVEGFDEEVDEGDEVFADDEYDSPKGEAAGLMARTAAEGPRHDGPTTKTGVPLTEASLRPFVEAYATYALKKNLAGQGDIERKLGLDITRAGNWKSYKSEDQPATRERVIADAIASLIQQGKGQQGGEKKGQKPDASQMAHMKAKCANTAFGCDSPRHSHRAASGQCYEAKCACKGRCAAFVEGGGGPEGSDKRPEGAEPVAGGVRGVEVQGGGPAEGSSVPSGVVEGAPVPPSPDAPALEKYRYVDACMQPFYCARINAEGRVCNSSAILHQGHTGQMYIGGNQGGHVACKGFLPKTEEREAFVALVRQAQSYGLDIKLPKEVESGEGQSGEGQSAPVPGPGGVGSGGSGAGHAGSEVHGGSGGGLGEGGEAQLWWASGGEVSLGGRGGPDAPAAVGHSAGAGLHPSAFAPPPLPPAPSSVEGGGLERPAAAPGVPPLPTDNAGAAAGSAGRSAGPTVNGQEQLGPGTRPQNPGRDDRGAVTGSGAAPPPSDGHGNVPQPEVRQQGPAGQEPGPDAGVPEAREATLEEVIGDLAWAGGYVADGRVFVPTEVSEPPFDPAKDWWPVPAELDTHEFTEARRNRAIERMVKWWKAAIYVKPPTSALDFRDGVLDPALHLPGISYRIALAAWELAAQIEKYAKAWRDHNGGSSPILPDDVEEALVEKIRESAIAYLEAHKVVAEPDTDFITYMEACVSLNIEPGTPWADILGKLPKEDEGVF